MIRVVLDTNVMLQARARGHKYHVILLAWLHEKFALAVTTEILLEYEEVISRAGVERWKKVQSLLAVSSNVVYISPTYRFLVIAKDPDDNKFIDCAIAAEADWIITEDRHFDVLKGSGYKPQPISTGGFHQDLSRQDRISLLLHTSL